MENEKNKIFIFDFAGVISVGRLFPVIAKNLSKKFGIDQEIIKERLYANQEHILLGNESPEDFWKNVCAELPIPFADFKKAFTEWEINHETIALIKKLKLSHRIVLLSDNFEMTSEFLRNQPWMQELFEKMYFSNEIHMIKGGPEVFSYVLNDLGARGEDCIFIDDQEKNLTSPRELGIQCFLFESASKLREDLGE